MTLRKRQVIVAVATLALALGVSLALGRCEVRHETPTITPPTIVPLTVTSVPPTVTYAPPTPTPTPTSTLIPPTFTPWHSTLVTITPAILPISGGDLSDTP